MSLPSILFFLLVVFAKGTLGQLELCSINICFNFGTCILIDGQQTCMCLPVFTGALCELNVDACDSNPCLNNANCTDLIAGFQCSCSPGFTGRQCETDINECANNPCINGLCNDDINSYSCDCDVGYSGPNCATNIDDCPVNACSNGSTCIDRIEEYTCACPDGFAGAMCQLESNCSIDNDPCQNNALCSLVNNNTICDCLTGYSGELCETDINECASTPCKNGSCVDKIASFNCICLPGYTGDQCEIDIDECNPNPCQSGGVCEDYVNGFDCFCRQGFTGLLCQINVDDCQNVVCQNGGTCEDGVNAFQCKCQDGFSGEFCETLTDPCFFQPCVNGGTCLVTEDMYTCTCQANYTGFNCSIEITPCFSNPCLNGATCNDQTDNYTCICAPGYTGEECQLDINECLSDPCLNGATCNNLFGRFECICPPGYTGEFCGTNIDDCAEDPCMHNGTCHDDVNGYICDCAPGYTGLQCETDIDDCASSPCHSNATCIDLVNNFTCFCPLGLTGLQCLVNINDCIDNPCGNSSTCIDLIGGYQCMCQSGFTGDHCLININDCQSDSCLNNGTCVDGINGFTCICTSEYTGDNCESEVDYCDSNPCSQQATCVSMLSGYICICPDDYTGPDCSIQIDDCEPNLCLNGATCNDLIGTFQCVCAAGYTGTQCEVDINECDPNPCQNGGSCNDLINGFSCQCPPEFTGKSCELDTNNDCANVTCENNGKCKEILGGFECLCPNGFTGMFCQINIDDCASNPCLNNGTCVDEVGNYTCKCSSGYDGYNCAIDLDLCDPQPCSNGGSCVESLTGGYFNCTCPDGYDGVFCERDINECESEPCLNGGTCTNTIGSFECACPDSYVGTLCEVKLFEDCSDHPCQNNATCIDAGSGIGSGSQFTCQCGSGYTGNRCEMLISACDSEPCFNGGECLNQFGEFHCTCLPDFSGPQCEIDLNPCSSSPCHNNATCENAPQGNVFSCTCSPGYTGFLCDSEQDDCASNSCLNGGTCIDMLLGFKCKCPPGYSGTRCNVTVDPCSSNPCLNDSTCISNNSNGFICSCAVGFTGTLCDTNIDDCIHNPCMNNATCVDDVASFRCKCLDGYEGELCERERDDCANVSCHNGGQCIDVGASYICKCAAGFSGSNCEVGINECMDEPCQNGGICQDLVADYTCICALGYTGKNCTVNIDDCVGVVCENNGTCIDGINSSHCDCVIGWTGEFCEVMIDDCQDINCQNNGTCIDFLNTFQCVCQAGFTGQYCQINIDDCIGISCNNGSCQDLVDGYKCVCNLGYTGSLCELMVNDCIEVECLNGGFCQDLLNDFICQCPMGYTGRYCQTDIDECFGISCENNGTCKDLVNGFQCNCQDGFDGTYCENNIDECSSNPCLNNATCVDSINSVTCICSPLFTGQTCETEVNLCLSNPCQNGGICRPEISNGYPSYACNCIGPYRGDDCEIKDLCLQMPCQNNATCITNITDGMYICVCDTNYYSQNCEFFDYCYSSPCQNEGSCSNVILYSGSGDFNSLIPSQSDLYVCTCLMGYTGNDCGIEITPCYFSPCENGGTCHDDLERKTYSCDCPIGYTGQNCSQVTVSNTPYFRGDSYILVPYSLSDSNYTLLHISLQTQSNNGLVLFASNNDQSDYISLGVESSLLTLRLKQGQMVVNLDDHYHPIADGRWHSVSIFQEGSHLVLEVDGYRNSTQIIVSNSNLQSRTYLGGIDNFTILPNDISQSSGFIGLLNITVEIGGTNVHIINDSIAGINVGDGAPALCTPDSCSNGGICQEDGIKYSCLCPLGFGGIYCSEDLDIRIPYFSNTSYLIVQKTNSSETSLEVDLAIHTTATDGLLFLIYDNTNYTDDYFSLILMDASLTIQYDFGSGVKSLFYNGNISDDNWHIITALYNTTSVFLAVDDNTVIDINIIMNDVIELNSPLFLGGIPYGLNTPLTTDQRNGFIGCIRDLQVNNNKMDIVSDSLYGLDITECPKSVCSYVQCANGGTCENVQDNVAGFRCTCPYGYSGQYCEVSLPLCSPNPCLYGGICEEFDDRTFSCLCTLGRQGRLCEQELNITIPSFFNKSYIIYPSLSNVASTLSITITFYPTKSDGLLLFNALSNNDFSDYISIALVNSFIVYRFNLGSGAAQLSSPQQITLDQWHIVTVNRTRQVGFLQVDNQSLVTGQSLGTFTGLNIAGSMWLGGYNQFMILSQFSGTNVGFSGCISSVSVKGTHLELIIQAESGYGISECNITICKGNPCFNGATCVENSNSFTCVCPPGFNGPLCAVQLKSCASSPCMNGGTCLEVMNGANFTCHCPLGYAGYFCEENIVVTLPSFSGQSFLQYSSPVGITSSTSVSLTFYPTSQTGLLFYIGDVTLSRDFLSLSLVNGFIEFRYDLGSGPAMIMTNVSIMLNHWHTIQATRTRKSGSLTVDSSDTYYGTSPGTTSLLNAQDDLYIGGIDESARVSSLSGTKVGLTGCIDTDSVQINGNELGSVIVGRNIVQCSVDSCVSSPCQNGGSCISTGVSYTCVCSLGFAGSICENVIDVDIPSFLGSSYLSYPTLTNSFAVTQLYIELFPNVSNGLILYNSQTNGSDYISISLKNGIVEYRYDLGSGPAVITSSSSISLGQWHSIEVSRTGPKGNLIVDNGIPVTRYSPGDSTSLQLGEPLYLGGITDYSLLPQDLGVSQGLVGCVRLLKVSPNNAKINLINDATNGAGVTQCTVMMGCFTNPCQNGGQCIAEYVNDTVLEQCDCSLPYASGDRCTERVSFGNASFTSNSYLQFSLNSIPISSITIHTTIQLSITPTSTSGLLLYMGPNNPATGDHILVGLVDGKIEWRFDLGSGTGVIQSNEPLTLGTSYDINLLRTDNNGRLFVSGQSYVNGNSPGSLRHLNFIPYDFVMYLGGSSDVSVTSGQVYSTGFSGCVSQPVKLGYTNNVQSISFDTSSVGQYVKPCSL